MITSYPTLIFFLMISWTSVKVTKPISGDSDALCSTLLTKCFVLLIKRILVLDKIRSQSKSKTRRLFLSYLQDSSWMDHKHSYHDHPPASAPSAASCRDTTANNPFTEANIYQKMAQSSWRVVNHVDCLTRIPKYV